VIPPSDLPISRIMEASNSRDNRLKIQDRWELFRGLGMCGGGRRWLEGDLGSRHSVNSEGEGLDIGSHSNSIAERLGNVVLLVARTSSARDTGGLEKPESILDERDIYFAQRNPHYTASLRHNQILQIRHYVSSRACAFTCRHGGFTGRSLK
jgi:hypothetical protein